MSKITFLDIYIYLNFDNCPNFIHTGIVPKYRLECKFDVLRKEES